MKQLRPFYSDEEESALYVQPYSALRWQAHRERVNFTASLLESLAADTGGRTVADLSCGDGAVIEAARAVRWERIYLGDVVARPGLDIVGPIEETIELCPPSDIFVCSETIEHLRNPLHALKRIRLKTCKALLLSTPWAEDDDENPEHYWGFDVQDISKMLWDAGFHEARCDVELFTPRVDDYYTFQIWTVKLPT